MKRGKKNNFVCDSSKTDLIKKISWSIGGISFSNQKSTEEENSQRNITMPLQEMSDSRKVATSSLDVMLPDDLDKQTPFLVTFLAFLRGARGTFIM